MGIVAPKATEHGCAAKTDRARVRHRPEETVLHQVLSEHFERFADQAEDQAGGLSAFVLTEVREYLRCGLLEHGLLHCRCRQCGHAEVCAFSCKRRGFCPSCLGRRMTDTALNRVEQVLPEGVPLRQWVCSLPWRLRVVCGYASALCADVMKGFEKEVSRSLRRRSKQALGFGSIKEAHTGSVLFIQRFDSALRLNVHAHLLSLDSVYVRAADGALRFHVLGARLGVIVGLDLSLRCTGMVGLPVDWATSPPLDWTRVHTATVGESLAMTASEVERCARPRAIADAALTFAREHEASRRGEEDRLHQAPMFEPGGILVVRTLNCQSLPPWPPELVAYSRRRSTPEHADPKCRTPAPHCSTSGTPPARERSRSAAVVPRNGVRVGGCAAGQRLGISGEKARPRRRDEGRGLLGISVLTDAERRSRCTQKSKTCAGTWRSKGTHNGRSTPT